jgi:hypothetical protein
VLLQYVAKRRFITQNSEISTRKDSKNLETEWQKQQLLSNFRPANILLIL